MRAKWLTVSVETCLRAALWTVLLAVVAYTRTDPDLWGHVQYGRDALRFGVPRATTYSYVARGYPWINHEILAELGLALSYDYLGACGLMLLKVGLGMGVIGLMVMARHGLQADDPPPWFVVLFCLVFILGGIWHWWALTRPAVRQWLASSQAKALPASSS